MPRKKSKSKKGRTEIDEPDLLDSASVISLTSEESEAHGFTSADVEDIAVVRSILDKINTTIDALTEKRPETRINALSFLLDAFRLHYLCLDESWNYCDTFLSGIEYILRKGRSHDQALAVECLAVFCLQTDVRGIADYFSRFLPILDTGLRNTTASSEFRSACATALSVLQFVTGHCDFVSPKTLMKSFEEVFRGSCLKGDGKAPAVDPSLSLLHISALRAWGLLYTILTPYDADAIGKALLPTLVKLLQTTNVDMRIMAGETAALIYERIRTEIDERFKGPYYSSLVELLNELATDGAKSRSKVDRKKQRHFFREFSDTLSGTDIPETSITVGSEVLVLSSCTDHFHYEIMCYLLKGGLCRHLQENCMIRDLFDLGLPITIPQSHYDRRAAKGQRRLELSFASKLRTQKLSSHRDRRINVITEIE